VRASTVRELWWPYLVALAALIAALALRALLAPWLGGALPFITVYAAIGAAMWYGGFGPALLVAVAGYWAGALLFLPPGGGYLDPWGLRHLTGLWVYALASAVLMALVGGLRRAQQRTAASAAADARLAAVLRQTHDPIVALDAAGRFSAWNPAAERVFGYTRDDVLGRDSDFMTPPELRSERAAQLERVRRGESVSVETVRLARDGTRLQVLLTMAPMHDADGGFAGVSATVQEIGRRREAEATLRAFYENAPVCMGVVELTDDGDILHVYDNALACRLYEVAPGSSSGRLASQLGAPPEARQRWLEHYRESERSGGPVAFTFLSTRFAQGRWFSATVSPIGPGPSGRMRFCYVVEDITERHQAQARVEASEAALRHTGEQLRLITDSLPVLVSYVDADGRYRLVNATYERWFDRPRDSMVGRTMREVLGEPAWRVIGPHADAALRGEAVSYDSEVDYGAAAGRRWIEASYVPHRADDGRVLGFVVLAADVSERRRAAARVEESEAAARLAMQVAQLGTWSWEPSTGALQADRRAREICGLDTDAALTLADVLPRLHADDAPRVEAALQRALQPDSDGGYHEEFRFVLDGGGEAWVVSRGQMLFGGQGEATLMLGTVFDVTERRRHEELLRSVDRQKDEFLATLAHELRNPLAPIRNGVELLRRTDSGAAREPLAIIERQLAHMVRLIDDLLDLSRIGRGKLELRRSVLPLARVIDDAVETSRPAIEASRHALRVALPETALYIDADLTRLSQVFANLLNNAAKFMPAGGRIELVAQRRGDEVQVAVEDDGDGMPPEMLPRIFEMFTQIDRRLERTQGGLGIGLAIARRLVELHGGRLEASSQGLGRGSRFTVTLPLAAAQQAGHEPASAAERTAAGARRVLVADDNRDSADSLAELLMLLGNETRVARDGEQALDVAAQFRPDVALLDIGMPKLSGLDVARRLRTQPWGRDIVLIAVTGWGQEADRQRSREAGFDHHVVKPVDPALLEQLLHRRVERRGV
jgi:PAS domain S-box-containing protein